MKPSLAPGIVTTERVTIDKGRTISFMGEDLRVYATPSMVLDFERVCHDLVAAHLDPNEDTVGARIEIDHLGPTLLGMWVELSARVAEVDGRRVTLALEARDALDQVGRGTHIRFVVDIERQKQRLAAKAARLNDAG